MNSGLATSRGRGSASRLSLSMRPGPGRHHDDAVGEEDRFLDRVRDEDHGQPGALPDVEKLVLQALARHRVERAERLVHQHDLGVVGEHAGDRHALLHAARELVRIGVGELLSGPTSSMNLSTVSLTSAAAEPARCRAEADVVAHRQPGEQGVILEHHAARRVRVLRSACPTSAPRPVEGCSKPAMMRSRVDLPQPEAPIRQTNSPLRDGQRWRRTAHGSSAPAAGSAWRPGLISMIGIAASAIVVVGLQAQQAVADA